MADEVVIGLLLAAWRRLWWVDPPSRLGRCPGCGHAVFDWQPHVRYRRDVLHAEPCVEVRSRRARV